MAPRRLPNLPDDIIIKILEYLSKETFEYLGGFLRARKRGYELVHQPSVLKICDVSYMTHYSSFCQIGDGGKFRDFFLKCVNAENIWAIYFAGIHAAGSFGIEESTKILEPNVPRHGYSTLVVGIFNVMLGKREEAVTAFQQFQTNHHDLRSEEILDIANSIEWCLLWSGAQHLNEYCSTYRYPNSDLVHLPECILQSSECHSLDSSCGNCRLYWVCAKIGGLL